MLDLLPRDWVKKDPHAVLRYTFDWSVWLAESEETIASAVWTVGAGLTKDAESNTSTATTVTLSGGTAGIDYAVACKVTTSGAQVDERTLTVRVRER